MIGTEPRRCVRLPLGRPPVRAYHYLAYPLSVMAVRDDYLPWLHTHFVQLCCSRQWRERGAPDIDFYRYDFTVAPLPWLDMQRVRRDVVCPPGGDMKDVLKRILDAGHYIYLFLDEFYMEGKRSFQEKHYRHDNFIYGYDDESGSFLTVGYDKDGRYAQTPLAYPIFDLAFAPPGEDDPVKDEVRYLHLFRYDDSRAYAFDRDMLLRLLRDYVESRDSSRLFAMVRNRADQLYGMKVYDELIHYIGALPEGDYVCDVRPLYVLWEHKARMADRARYLFEKGLLSADGGLAARAEELEREAHTIVLALLKYERSGDIRLIRPTVRRLTELRTKESAVMEEWIRALNEV